ncbi:Flagellar basal-body rod protein FlgF [Rhodovulum sp. P5]|uniref:DUF1217 domain-containing protein n=1 Tax=Rhodovulum sp. P5 TaxID=1564506 RepID=UPI0009C2EB18|nr:DUF1217 domain-containing protein [Rhodovulum sp. P5]ARE40395.1 Flagellar basal-body rod protein FlgF [Rhodovulum sp. P5]
MTYTPVVPMSGIAGWTFLERTRDLQQQAYNQSQTVQNDVEYFAENIGKVETAEQLVSDYRLLKVALGAFGLQDEIANKFFIQKVLADGVLADDALANKVADKTYYKLSEAFGFNSLTGPETQTEGFAEKITDAYMTRSFEIAVGEQDNAMRLAMNLDRDLADLAESDMSENARWYSIMGSEPLREVFDTAFGLSDYFAALDVDKQLETYRDKADAYFGDEGVSQFADDEKRQELINLFLARSEIASGISGYSPAHTALALLGG